MSFIRPLMRSRFAARAADWLSQMASHLHNWLTRQMSGAQMERLVKRASAVFLTQVAGGGIMFLHGILLARWLRPEAYGFYSFAVTLIIVLRILANFGLPLMLQRSVAVYGAAKNWPHLKGLLQYALKLSIGSGALTALATAAVILFLTPHPFGRTGGLILLALPLLCLMPISESAAGVLRGLHQVSAGQATEAIRSAIYLALIVLTYLVLRHMTASTALILRIIAEAAGAALIIMWLRRHLPTDLKSAAAAFDVKTWRQGQLSFMAIEAMYLIYLQTDILVLGAMRPMAEVGVYRMASNLTLILSFAAMIATSSLGPLAASAWAAGHKDELADVSRRMSRLAFFLTLAVYVALLIAIPVFISILGVEYSALGLPLVILGLAQVLRALLSASPSLVLMTNGEREGAWCVGASAASNLLLNLALIPLLGMAGSAIATALSTMLQTGLYAWFAYRRTGISGAAIADERLIAWWHHSRVLMERLTNIAGRALKAALATMARTLAKAMKSLMKTTQP
ncbi:MAG TPA: oligosaccharide flippase family protein [Alphaproteobacteria bacterium]|nr:oligosaccharide flippase family protein [Alphaproteobacteria bacterium]